MQVSQYKTEAHVQPQYKSKTRITLIGRTTRIFRGIRYIRAIRVKNFSTLPGGGTSFTHDPN
jgi:hypothetical protein